VYEPEKEVGQVLLGVSSAIGLLFVFWVINRSVTRPRPRPVMAAARSEARRERLQRTGHLRLARIRLSPLIEIGFSSAPQQPRHCLSVRARSRRARSSRCARWWATVARRRLSFPVTHALSHASSYEGIGDTKVQWIRVDVSGVMRAIRSRESLI
jgi:hypothetical protein